LKDVATSMLKGSINGITSWWQMMINIMRKLHTVKLFYILLTVQVQPLLCTVSTHIHIFFAYFSDNQCNYVKTALNLLCINSKNYLKCKLDYKSHTIGKFLRPRSHAVKT
jgi:hypothetical protein